MPKDRSLVRASDIGAWAFCRRAWWLAEVKKVAHADPAILAQGEQAHLHHGRQVLQAQRLQQVGGWLLVAGCLMAMAAALWFLLG